jgi:tetratricopeptide (TPR) repeat protein
VSTVFIVLAGIFGFLASITGGALLTVHFTKGQRKRYPILTKLDGKQLHLLITTIVFAAIAFGSSICKDIWAKPVVVLIPDPHEAFTPKATLAGFEKELKEAAAERESEARDYFKTAERDLAAQRYPDAASNYRKSIELLPTMSGYLNVGISLGHTSNFREAEEAFVAGLQIARKKGRKEFEAAFLGNIGRVHENLGKFEEALKAYQVALELARQLDNAQWQANTLNNMGNVYRTQGKRAEALNAYQEALALSKQGSSLLSQADALNNFGTFYREQGQVEQAMMFYPQALELLKQLGNRLEQARVLNNLGNLYEAQDKPGEALTSFQQSLALQRHFSALNKFTHVES